MTTSRRSKRLRVGGQAETIDLVVDRRFLLYVGIGLRDVGLRLVIVVVRDEVLHGGVREERPELLIQLGRQRLVVSEDQSRTVHLSEHGRHRERLAAAGDTQKDLMLVVRLDACDELLDRLRLVSAGLEIADELETSVGRRGNQPLLGLAAPRRTGSRALLPRGLLPGTGPGLGRHPRMIPVTRAPPVQTAA